MVCGGYLLIPGPGPAALPPPGAPLLGLGSCPEPGGAEAAGTAEPACPGAPSPPSRLASFPIVDGTFRRGDTPMEMVLQPQLELGSNSTLFPFRHHHLRSSIPSGAGALTEEGALTQRDDERPITRAFAARRRIGFDGSGSMLLIDFRTWTTTFDRERMQNRTIFITKHALWLNCY